METNKKGLHIGLIMDGNGRWATKQNQPRLFGHAHGVQTVIDIVHKCPDIDVHTITLFAFAIANWKRDAHEVDGLWKLFHQFITSSSAELIENDTRIIFIGNREGLPVDVKNAAEKLELASANNTSVLLQIALNYDGADEVARLIKRVITTGVTPEDITSQYIQSHLDTEPNNNPDIIVRTGLQTGENGMALWRSSGFLPIQSMQSVCVSTDVLWPDFTIEHLKEIITYAKPEERLFGGQRKEK